MERYYSCQCSVDEKGIGHICEPYVSDVPDRRFGVCGLCGAVLPAEVNIAECPLDGPVSVKGIPFADDIATCLQKGGFSAKTETSSIVVTDATAEDVKMAIDELHDLWSGPWSDE